MRFYFLSQEGRLNKERYSDPTAEKAIAHVMRERKKQEGDNLVNFDRGVLHQDSCTVCAR